MRLKWLNYYKIIPDIYLVALVFDPRCKLKELENFLNAYFPMLQVEDDPECYVLIILRRTKCLIQELFDHYRVLDVDSSSATPLPPTPPSSSSRTSISSRAKSLARDIFGTKRARTQSSSNDELQEYYETTFDDLENEEDDFDILAWWRRPERMRYPTLKKIAKQVLAFPASTIAVEQTFP